MAAFAQWGVSIGQSAYLGSPLSSFLFPGSSGSGRSLPLRRSLKVVGGNKRPEEPANRGSFLVQRQVTCFSAGGPKKFPFGESRKRDERNDRKCCIANSSLAAEPSTSEESPVASAADSEEGAPMRKSNFVARIQRAVVAFFGFLKRFSPDNLLKGLWAFLRGPGRRQMMLWSIMGCTMGLVYLSASLTGNASPQVVPYSELVVHLQSKTVTTALFEEGSSHLYFNVQEEGEVPAVVEANGGVDAAEQISSAGDGKELTASMALAQEGLMDIKNERTEELGENTLRTSSEVSVPKKSITAQKRIAKPKWAYSTRRVKNDEAFLLPLMRDAGVQYSSAPQSISAALKTVLITVITLWIPLSPLLWLLHRQMSQNSSNGKKRRNVNRLVRFEDVAGVDIAKAELMEIVECMRGAAKFASLGAKVPKGVLLVGPPGTGKTLLARAVAGEAGVPFYAASASEFVEMFVGRGAARIRELFSEARRNTPSIVFIDELDAVGGRRGRSFNDERDQTLNQLLTEMDGFESDSGVLVLAATNRPEALDPALCRPGRLSRRVHVTEPDLQGRQQVLAVHMRGVPVDEDPFSLQRLVASMTGGFVGADLANLVNEAALLAARKGRSAVTFEDFKEAVDRIKYGIGDRRRNVFNEMEEKLGSWFSSLSPEATYPILPSSG
ncbi:unnamed protein product [Calypogeia fissa]